MQLKIDTLCYGADAVARTAEGKTVFVSGGVPGDVVEAEITSDGKTFSKARVTSVVEASADRVTSKCPYSAICGGCPWAKVSIDAQRQAKRKNVVDALMRIGKFDDAWTQEHVGQVVEVGPDWGYRNKVELACVKQDGRMRLGMHSKFDANQVIAVDKCPLMAKDSQKLVKSVAGALNFFGGSRDLGLERVGIRVSERTRQVEVALWTDPAAFPRAEIAKVITDAAKPTSIARVMTKEKGGARKIAGVECLSGRGRWEERLAGQTMSLSAPSFFQVNTAGAEKLIELVLEGLAIEGDEVACDLYCGAGTFTLPLARAAQGGVIAIESYGPAVRDLKQNLEHAGLADMVEAIGDDAARQLDCLEDADAIVVDPPRAGLERSVIAAVCESPARAVAYVSCDPATLARDLAIFRELETFDIVSITPVDLFPQTFHVENVTILRRR